MKEYLESLPKKGWGFASKFSDFSGVSQALFSQVVSSEKEFTPEQAYKFCEYIKLNEIEKEYFLELVQKDRAALSELKGFHEKRLQKIQAEGLKASNHVTDKKEMSPEEKMEFYSNYLFSAIRIFSSLDDGKTFDEIQKYFQVPPLFLKNILDFLVQYDLCYRMGDRYRPGNRRTWAEKGTPFYFKHSTNWRLQGIAKLELNRKDDIFITSPMSISIEDAKIIKNQILELVKNISARVNETEAEQTLCLNIDFFKF